NDGFVWRSDGLPSGAPLPAHSASVESSALVRRRFSRPTRGAESSPGIQGGISPAFVIRTIPAACAFAWAAVVREKGAIPPSRWHEAHFESRIGATSR